MPLPRVEAAASSSLRRTPRRRSSAPWTSRSKFSATNTPVEIPGCWPLVAERGRLPTSSNAAARRKKELLELSAPSARVHGRSQTSLSSSSTRWGKYAINLASRRAREMTRSSGLTEYPPRAATAGSARLGKSNARALLIDGDARTWTRRHGSSRRRVSGRSRSVWKARRRLRQRGRDTTFHRRHTLVAGVGAMDANIKNRPLRGRAADHRIESLKVPEIPRTRPSNGRTSLRRRTTTGLKERKTTTRCEIRYGKIHRLQDEAALAVASEMPEEIERTAGSASRNRTRGHPPREG